MSLQFNGCSFSPSDVPHDDGVVRAAGEQHPLDRVPTQRRHITYITFNSLFCLINTSKLEKIFSYISYNKLIDNWLVNVCVVYQCVPWRWWPGCSCPAPASGWSPDRTGPLRRRVWSPHRTWVNIKVKEEETVLLKGRPMLLLRFDLLLDQRNTNHEDDITVVSKEQLCSTTYN